MRVRFSLWALAKDRLVFVSYFFRHYMWFNTLLGRIGVPAAYIYTFVAITLAGRWQTSHPLLAFGLITTVALIIYARFVEPQWLQIKRIRISAHVPRPVKIALLADLHVSCYKGTAWLERVVAEVLTAEPDLVLIAGDLINNQFAKVDETKYLKPLAKLAQHKIFYVLGNHEYGTDRPQHHYADDRSTDLMRTMSTLGIPLLRNSITEITLGTQKITLFGSDDLWSQPINYDALQTWDKGTPLFFVTHNPDTILTWPTDMPKPTFAFGGHSHGGQFALFGFPLGSANMQLGRAFYRGFHMYNNIPLYVSPGLGESTIPFRFGVRPELSIITLEP